MSNFRLLGKAMIDFSRVRAVTVAAVDDAYGKGFWVQYALGQGDDVFVQQDDPEVHLKEFYARERNLDDSIVVGEEE